jgi:hypothetical protein
MRPNASLPDLKLALLLAATLVSIACQPPEQAGDTGLDDVALPDRPLVPANAETLKAYLTQAVERHLPLARPLPEADLVMAPGDPSLLRFSTTNLQTNGVDEADIVKFDGETLFVAKDPLYRFGDVEPGDPDGPVVATPVDFAPILSPELIEPARVAVYTTREDPAEAEQVASILLPEDLSIHGLILLPGEGDAPPLLAVIGGNPYPFWGPSVMADSALFQYGDERVRLWIFDVSNPRDPQAVHRSEFEGSLLTVRRIGGQLVIVSRFTPFVLYLTPESDATSRAEALEALGLEALLPRVWVGEEGEQMAGPLVRPERCFVPEHRTDADPDRFYHPTLVTITTLDLRAPDEPSSVCAAGPADRIYSSTGALYLTSTSWSSSSHTVIHKFAYSDRGPEFRGSGHALGVAGGVDPDFGLGEVDDVFGIVTVVSGRTPEGGFDSAPRLTLLAEAGDGSLELEELSHLPNAREPARIGKPGEQLRAVRFIGHRLYAVTFRRIDPLYVIDIGDPRNPRIAGELEIPGFSDLLQPVGPDLLLGIGKDSIAALGNDWFQGVKLELFDVSDPSAPKSVDSIVIGRRGSDTSAAFDHHALSAMELANGTTRVAIPIDVAESPPVGLDVDDPMAWWGWSRTGLHLFEVDHASRSLVAAGAIIVSEEGDESPTRGTWRDRSRLQGEAVHYLHDGGVWSAPWADPDDAVGPN